MLRDRRTLITMAVAVMLLAGLAWAWFGPAAQAPAAVAPGQSSAARRASERQEAALPPAADVKLSALESPRAEPGEATRNPFRFEQRAAAAADKPADTTAPGLVVMPTEPAAPAGPPRSAGARRGSRDRCAAR